MTFGNGVVETTSYSGNRQQAIGVTAVKTGTTLLALGYSHCSTYSEPCTNNNGNVWQQTMARPAGTWTQDYGYTDGLNRLNSVAETGPGTGWSEKYGYDAFGNRWVNPTTEQTLTAETPTGASWYLSNNRISGWGYDSAGNITSVSSMQRTFTYDAENRQTSATINSASATYGYDGQGQRVTKTAGGATTVYVYDAQGDLVEELGGANSDAGTLYLTVDTLGSTRLVTDGNGAQHLCYDYLPFGQEIPAGTDGRPGNCFTTDTLDTKFTSKERDAETGLDFFGARYFSSAQGRFTSPDIPLADQHPEDPQSWNLYSYVRNNPLSYGDPSGGECVKLDGGRVGDDGQGNACQDKSLQTTSGVTVNGTTGAATFSAFGNAVNMGDIDPSGGRDRIYGQTADIVSNITNAKAMLGIAKVGLTVGSLALAMAKLKPAEQAILEELIAAGRTVEVIPTAGGRTADFLVNGVPTELKTLTAAGPTTLKNAVQSAAKQGEQILIDARNVNLTPQEALSQIQRAQGNVGGLQGRVTVLTKSGTVTF
jgi:RHS repeat-associated protein